MGMHLHIVKLEECHKIGPELHEFLEEHGFEFGGELMTSISYDELVDTLELKSRHELLTCARVPDQFKELIKDRIGKDDHFEFVTS